MSTSLSHITTEALALELKRKYTIEAHWAELELYC